MKLFTYSMTQIYVYIHEYKCVPINDDKMLKMNTDTRTTKFQHRLFCRSRRQLDLRMRAPSTHLAYTLMLRDTYKTCIFVLLILISIYMRSCLYVYQLILEFFAIYIIYIYLNFICDHILM